ncbi:MAG: hypothetical protein ACLT5P_05490 [Flavonifractor plautii]
MDAGSRIYDIIVCVILFITVLFANFAEAVAEGRGKAQAASLKKHRRTRKPTCSMRTAARPSSFQRAEERRCRHGDGRRGHPQRR